MVFWRIRSSGVAAVIASTGVLARNGKISFRLSASPGGVLPDTTSGDGQDVIEAKIRVPGVDTDITAFAGLLFQCLDNQGARRRLFGDGDGVLQIQDDRVAVQGESFFDPAGMVTGRKQVGTVNGHGMFRVFLWLDGGVKARRRKPTARDYDCGRSARSGRSSLSSAS